MIGVDIVSIARIKKAVENKAFRDNVFTESEQKYCDRKPAPEQSYAGLFCAKEAAVKAVKKGFGELRPIDIEVVHSALGAPGYVFHGAAQKLFEKYFVDLSVSHDGDNAIAVAEAIEKQQ